MTFEQLLAKAAEEANENELVILNLETVRSYLDSNENSLPQEFDNALDWAQGEVHTGEKKVSWVLIKIVK
jgi:hypothetical protein